MAIKKCNGSNCVSEFQDKKYGVGMRVQNDSKPPKGWRCSVCQNVINNPKADGKK